MMDKEVRGRTALVFAVACAGWVPERYALAGAVLGFTIGAAYDFIVFQTKSSRSEANHD